MASMNVTHCKMGIVDAAGNISQFCPKVFGTDVIVSGNEYGSGNSMQELVDNLSDNAFDNVFGGINDELESSYKYTMSAKKLNGIINFATEEPDDLDNAYNDGCTVLSQTLTNLGVATDTKNPSDIVKNTGQMANLAYTTGYNKGVTDTKKGNATSPYVLAGKTFTSASAGVGVAGTMVNRGNVSRTIGGGSSNFGAGLYAQSTIKGPGIKQVQIATSGYSSRYGSAIIPTGVTPTGIYSYGIRYARLVVENHDYNNYYEQPWNYNYSSSRSGGSVQIESCSISGTNIVVSWYINVSGYLEEYDIGIGVVITYNP